ncbi:hypothetical protein HO173_005003 [Letharia columbiana]|uniref:Uncharacterized protein n=1 Tax=Letharia columbiana TaxID=112416 RepID=A0A8H6FXT2_9LECA|nr:uncharacterized protein HO173_005003 [Letharia columbiana]KAF6236712.1 hypothetical protein HO173_005003 [Letharia columbiana]
MSEYPEVQVVLGWEPADASTQPVEDYMYRWGEFTPDPVFEDGKAAFCVYTYEQPNDRESVISQSFRIPRTVLDMEPNIHFRGMVVEKGRLEGIHREESGSYTLQMIDEKNHRRTLDFGKIKEIP